MGLRGHERRQPSRRHGAIPQPRGIQAKREPPEKQIAPPLISSLSVRSRSTQSLRFANAAAPGSARNYWSGTALLIRFYRRSECRVADIWREADSYDVGSTDQARGSLAWRPRMRVEFIVLLSALALPVYAQDGHLGHGHDQWHQSFYNTLQRPDGKGSCCNLTDCRPTSIRTINGRYEIKKDGRWIPLPYAKIIKRLAPDGGAHICAPESSSKAFPADEVFCVVM